jgi:origin recognition complex subunit 1
MAESDALARESDAAPTTPSKTRRNERSKVSVDDTANGSALQKRAGLDARAGIVTIATIKQAINEATSSPLQQYLRALPLASKVFLAALLARIRRTGISEAMLGDVIEEAKRLGLMSQLEPVHQYLLAEDRGSEGSRPKEGHTPSRTAGRGTRQADSKAARAVGLGAAAIELAEAGIVGVEARRGERVGRVRLGVGDEEVRLALGDDEEVKGLGFGT